MEIDEPCLEGTLRSLVGNVRSVGIKGSMRVRMCVLVRVLRLVVRRHIIGMPIVYWGLKMPDVFFL